jgi:hypothetical protein
MTKAPRGEPRLHDAKGSEQSDRDEAPCESAVKTNTNTNTTLSLSLSL